MSISSIKDGHPKRRWWAIRDPRILFLVLVAYSWAGGCMFVYGNSMITTFEKRFDMSSKTMGVLLGGNDIGYLTCVILVSYIATKVKKSIILTLSASGQVIGCLIMALPYFIFGPKYNADEIFQLGSSIQSTSDPELCRNISASEMMSNWTQITTPQSLLDPPSRDMEYESKVSFALLLIGSIVSGVASTPFWNVGLAIIDDMAGEKSGIYMAMLFMSRAIAPLLGYQFGAWAIKQHETMGGSVAQYSPGQKDPKWIGAWWFGYVVMAGITLVVIPFLAIIDAENHDNQRNEKTNNEKIKMFKNNEMKADESNTFSIMENQEKENDDPLTDITQFSLKELLLVMKKLIINPVYSMLVIGKLFEIIAFLATMTFVTKYMEFHFRLNPSVSSSYTGVIGAGSKLLATFLSGLISHLFKMSIRRMNLFHAIMNVLAILPLGLLLLFSCENAKIIGFNENQSGIAGECTSKCACPIKSYNPVCSGDKTFFSPCMAGCSYSVNQTYGNCACGGETAVKGVCEGICTMVYPFLVVIFLTNVVNGIPTVQTIKITVSVIEKKYKPIPLAIVSFIYGIVGLIMPPIGGAIIDTACLFKSTKEQGGQNFCLLYDAKKLHYMLNGFNFGIQLPALIFYAISWWYTSPDASNEETNSEIPPEMNNDNNSIDSDEHCDRRT